MSGCVWNFAVTANKVIGVARLQRIMVLRDLCMHQSMQRPGVFVLFSKRKGLVFRLENSGWSCCASRKLAIVVAQLDDWFRTGPFALCL